MTKAFLKRMMLTLLLIVLGLYGLVALVLYTQQRQVIYPIGMTRQDPQPIEQPSLQLLKRAIPQGEVEAYLWRVPGEAKGLVVYFHGNGNIAEDGLALAKPYHDMGYHVLIPEYRGYGRSAGQPTQNHLVEDSVDFIKQARSTLHPRHIIYHGYSLGGGVAAAVAREVEPDGLVLQSTFTSIKDIALDMAMPPFLVKDPYPTKAFLKIYNKPVLIVHGTRDKVVPFEHGRALAKQSKTSTFIEDQGTHVSLADRKRVWSAIATLLADVAQ